MKHPIFYIINNCNALEAYSNDINLISKYSVKCDKSCKIMSLSKKKFFKKFIDVEDKELVSVKNVIIIKGQKDYLEKIIDNELYTLADTIEYLKTIHDRFNLSEKEAKKISKANQVLMDIFDAFEEYYDSTNTLHINKSLIEEMRQQERHLKEI